MRKHLEEQLQGSVASNPVLSCAFAQPALLWWPWKHLGEPSLKTTVFGMPPLQKLSTQQLWFMMRKVAERPGPPGGLESSGTDSRSCWACHWAFRVTGTGFGWDRHREFLNWATRGAETPRGMGVFMRSNFVHKNIPFFDYTVHGLDKSRVKSCLVQLGSCNQSLM